MNHRILAGVLAGLMISGTALADPQPEWTDHNASDPGVTSASSSSKLAVKSKDAKVESVQPELSNIVVLCASEKEEQFEKEWRQYVNKKGLKGAELKQTIAWVSKEAAQKRKQDRSAEQSAEADEAWLEKRRAFMQEVAEKALNPVR
ncbi:MAG: hypothetical protein HKN58_11635 [Xanthomonadales bacterium]|nr:hypothetical protein [Xanthomonadales bacterium]